ncbi:hypothetical protein [Fimbriiglobus ruber]|uniref:Lipoprotein n=1 Tax=Fimbriiglobus ruber TaxID=1908690 RepID=A0A225DGA8_9BACT|nr:hypothetical protein [Fimbriiglobus ruber]OWK37538.1 hypothetical protein FRUB_06658 [Fimbriiglobus ruber]
MRHAFLPAVAGLGLSLALGCGGPLTTPLPARLTADDQKQVDDSWDRALTPVGKHDRQAWLDTMVVSRAYENGVDSFSFHSEKRWTGGKVVMEARYDRAKPADDRFEVTVYDLAGKVLRKEVFGRDEVEQTFQDFAAKTSGGGAEPPEEAARRAALEARLNRIKEMLPQPKDEAPQPAGNPVPKK